MQKYLLDSFHQGSDRLSFLLFEVFQILFFPVSLFVRKTGSAEFAKKAIDRQI